MCSLAQLTYMAMCAILIILHLLSLHVSFFFSNVNRTKGTVLSRNVTWMIVNIICDFSFIWKVHMDARPVVLFKWLKF